MTVAAPVEPTEPTTTPDAPVDRGDSLDLAALGLEEEQETPVEPPKPADKPADIRIPKERFDEARKSYETKLAALQSELDKKNAAETVTASVKEIAEAIDVLQDRYETALADNDRGTAKELRRNINTLNMMMADTKATEKAAAARAEAVGDYRFEMALAKVEVEHPELDPESDDYDQEKTDEVADLVQTFIAAGIARNTALTKAVNYVMKGVQAPAPKLPATPAATSRTVAARQKIAEVSRLQPPSAPTGAKPAAAGTIDIRALNVDTYAKLSADDRARLRGDIL